MTTKEKTESRNKRSEEPRHDFTVLNDNRLIPEEKYDILKQLRLKLGKSREEFQKIFDLYYNLLGQKNS